MACVGRHEGTCRPTPGWAEKRRKQRGIGAALMYRDVLNAAIAGCKRAALWYLFVAVDKKVLGAVAKSRGGSTTARLATKQYHHAFQVLKPTNLISRLLSSPFISSEGGIGFALVNATILPTYSRTARVPFFARPKNGTQKRTPHTRLIPLPGTPSGVSLSGFLPRKLQPAIHGRLPPPVAPGSGACEGERKPSSRVAIEWLAQYHFVTFRCVPARRAGALSSYELDT